MGEAFVSLFCPEGRVFVHNDWGEGFPPSSRVPWFVPGGMVLDETDSRIIVYCSWP